MREIISMIVVLSCICGTSGFALSYLKQTTANTIEEQVLTYVQGPALTEIFGESENDPIAERKKFDYKDGKQITVFPIKNDGKLTAIALETFGSGYGGPIGVMVGINLTTDSLTGIGVTTMKETPGLGTKAKEPKYTSQYRGHSFTGVALDSAGGDITAISGATISTVGTINAVNEAVDIYKSLKGDIVKTW